MSAQDESSGPFSGPVDHVYLEQLVELHGRLGSLEALAGLVDDHLNKDLAEAEDLVKQLLGSTVPLADTLDQEQEALRKHLSTIDLMARAAEHAAKVDDSARVLGILSNFATKTDADFLKQTANIDRVVMGLIMQRYGMFVEQLSAISEHRDFFARLHKLSENAEAAMKALDDSVAFLRSAQTLIMVLDQGAALSAQAAQAHSVGDPAALAQDVAAQWRILEAEVKKALRDSSDQQ